MDIIKKIPTSIKIVAVTKNRTIQDILSLPDSIKDIGENKIQEAETKFKSLTKRKFTKHFIGHLQSNKVNKAIQLFDVIQSVDSIKLAQKINQLNKNRKLTKIMLQINVSNDPKKYGFEPNLEKLKNVIEIVKKCKNLKLIGLMTILKEYDNPKLQLKEFLIMQNLFNQINNTIMKANPLEYLSMGMSQDFEQAIKAKSNMVRLGKVLFQK